MKEQKQSIYGSFYSEYRWELIANGSVIPTDEELNNLEKRTGKSDELEIEVVSKNE